MLSGHDGNDCQVYELTDRSYSSSPSASSHDHDDNTESVAGKEDRRRRVHSIAANAEQLPYTVLKNVDHIPTQLDGYAGYQMKLFALKKKSPPTHVVKGIERVR